MLEVRVGGVVFEGSPRDRSRAFMIDPNGWSGWDEGTSIRREEDARPAAHGSFDAPGFLTPRVTTISGWILAPTPTHLAHMREQLTGLLADGSLGRMTVESPTGVTSADVRLAGQAAVTVRGQSRTEARYQIQFWAPDPRRYGEARTFGPGDPVTAHHYGNTHASPVLVVSGSSPGGYTISAGGRLITVTAALTSANPHTINLADGGLYVNGARVLGGISVFQPWTVPAGTAVTVSVSAGALTVKVRDTYV